MIGKCLHRLPMLSIEKEKSEELIKNREEILNEFTCDETKKTTFFISTSLEFSLICN